VKIALRRKWLIMLPTFAVTLALPAINFGLPITDRFRLPDLYLSSTLLGIKPSTLPHSVAHHWLMI
jgi:hypothetical protein